jgi:hypothetical protein
MMRLLLMTPIVDLGIVFPIPTCPGNAEDTDL